MASRLRFTCDFSSLYCRCRRGRSRAALFPAARRIPNNSMPARGFSSNFCQPVADRSAIRNSRDIRRDQVGIISIGWPRAIKLAGSSSALANMQTLQLWPPDTHRDAVCLMVALPCPVETRRAGLAKLSGAVPQSAGLVWRRRLARQAAASTGKAVKIFIIVKISPRCRRRRRTFIAAKTFMYVSGKTFMQARRESLAGSLGAVAH